MGANELVTEESPTNQRVGRRVSSDSLPSVDNLIVAGDGYAYVSYYYSQTNSQSGNPSTSQSSMHLNVMRVDSAGDYTKIPVKQWSNQSYSSTFLDGAYVPYRYAYCNAACIAYWGNGTNCAIDGYYSCAYNCEYGEANEACREQGGIGYVCLSAAGCYASAFVSSSTSSSIPNRASLITNADQGVVLSFQVLEGAQSSVSSYGTFPPPGPTTSSYSPGANDSYLATISPGGNVSLAQLNVPGQSGPVQPALQRADGS